MMNLSVAHYKPWEQVEWGKEEEPDMLQKVWENTRKKSVFVDPWHDTLNKSLHTASNMIGLVNEEGLIECVI